MNPVSTSTRTGLFYKEKTMGLTEFRYEQRLKSFGSSTMPCLLGVSPFQNAAEAILPYIADVERSPDTSFTLIGDHMEKPILMRAAEDLGIKITLNQYRSKPELFLHANIDAVSKIKESDFEAKWVTHFHPTRKDWGEPGTNQVPDHITVQATVHMICDDTELCYVPVILDGHKFEIYKVYRNEQLVKVIIDKAAEMWEKYVIPKKLPPNELIDYDLIKRTIREPKKTVIIFMADFTEFKEARAEKLAAEKRYKELTAKMLAQDVTAEEFKTESGDTVTFFRQSRQTVKVSDLRAAAEKLPDAHKEIILETIREIEYPVPRIKGVKNG